MINQSICFILLFALKKVCNHKHKNTGEDKLSFCIIGRCTIDKVRKDACQYHHPSRYPISQFTFFEWSRCNQHSYAKPNSTCHHFCNQIRDSLICKPPHIDDLHETRYDNHANKRFSFSFSYHRRNQAKQ